MLMNVNTTTDVSIQKDVSTKLAIFFVFAKMDGQANFAIRVSFFQNFKNFRTNFGTKVPGYRIN